jgi:hypothetical protein
VVVSRNTPQQIRQAFESPCTLNVSETKKLEEFFSTKKGLPKKKKKKKKKKKNLAFFFVDG